MSVKPEMRDTMWAHMKPYCYGGETCDQIEPQWNIFAEGDKQDDTISEPLELDARTFPPGTRIVVSEPLCPECGEHRSRLFPVPKDGPLFRDLCECGFDWAHWTIGEYS